MKKISSAVAVFLLSLLLVVSIGCDNKTGSDTGGSTSRQVGEVTLSIATDTLRFLPGDSASTTITVIVNDLQGNVMEGEKVNLSLSNPQLGFIEFLDTELRDTTNAQGRVDVLFTAIGTSGDNVFTASAGGVSRSRGLAIRPQSIEVGSLRLTVTPSELWAAEGAEETAEVEVSISDIQGNAIVGISLQLSATGGRLAPLPATDSSGVAKTTWYSNDEFGEFEINVSAGELERTRSIRVNFLENVNGTLDVGSDVPRIRADGCVTQAMITAVLKDQFGSAIANDTVRFGAPQIGSIQPWALTDGLGIATLPFCEYNNPNDPETQDSAMVVARYTPWGLSDTVRIWVAEAEAVDFVTLTVSGVTGTAGVDSISVNLEARYVSGAPVSGLWAKFNSSCGPFSADSMRVVNGHLENEVFYKMCTTIPAAADEPWVHATVGGVVSNSLVFDPEPGPASRIDVHGPLAVAVNEPTTVWASVQDTFGNLVRDGDEINFDASLGTIAFSAQTVGGNATTDFNPGTQAGAAKIRAWSGVIIDSTIIQVIAGYPNAIQLDVSESSLEVAGTGGTEWTQLRATVLDPNGNPIPNGTWVTFSILFSPGGGVNINDHGVVDSSQTAGGVAVATLNAGLSPGPVLVQASVWDPVNEITRTAQHGGITIVSGPPSHIIIYPNEIGESTGASNWDLEMGALVVDAQQNPVRCGVAVFFDVLPVSRAQILSRNVVTCNQNVEGDSSDGVAFTILRYESPETFLPVQITAATANGITATIDEFILPLQEGNMTLNCHPSSWHFGQSGDPCHIRCVATVQDGHGTAINGAPVYFASQRGLLYLNDNNGQNPSAAVSTTFSGPQGGNPTGEAILWLVDWAEYIFPDPITPEIAGEVQAEVIGYPEATDAQVINFRRGG